MQFKIFIIFAVLRLGRSVHSLDSALKSIHIPDKTLQMIVTTFYINQLSYLVVDHYLWMGKVGLTIVNKEWEITSARFFNFSIVLCIWKNCYLMKKNMEHLQDKDNPTFSASLLYEAVRKNPAPVVDLVRNLFDLPLPLSKLGKIKSNDGVLGFCGLMSSLIGIYQMLYPDFKPKP